MKGPLILLPFFFHLKKKDSANMITRISATCLFLSLQSVATHELRSLRGQVSKAGHWAVTVPLPEPTSQLGTARHLIEKLSFSSFEQRFNSWNQSTAYPLTVVAVVFHQRLWANPYYLILSAKSICQCFLSLDTDLYGRVFCQKLNAWVFSLPQKGRAT